MALKNKNKNHTVSWYLRRNLDKWYKKAKLKVNSNRGQDNTEEYKNVSARDKLQRRGKISRSK